MNILIFNAADLTWKGPVTTQCALPHAFSFLTNVSVAVEKLRTTTVLSGGGTDRVRDSREEVVTHIGKPAITEDMQHSHMKWGLGASPLEGPWQQPETTNSLHRLSDPRADCLHS